MGEFIVEVILRGIMRLVSFIFVKFIWEIILNFIGGSLCWVFGTIWRSISGEPKLSFVDYIQGKHFRDYGGGKTPKMVNGGIGFVAVFVIAFIAFL